MDPKPGLHDSRLTFLSSQIKLLIFSHQPDLTILLNKSMQTLDFKLHFNSTTSGGQVGKSTLRSKPTDYTLWLKRETVIIKLSTAN